MTTLFTTALPFRIDDLIILRICPIILPDSYGRCCYKIENLVILELIILKPVNNFLFGTSDFSFYMWIRKEYLYSCL
jgi:hypothetical protein